MAQTWHQANKKIREALNNKQQMENIITGTQKNAILNFIKEINKMKFITRLIFAWQVVKGKLGEGVKK